MCREGSKSPRALRPSLLHERYAMPRDSNIHRPRPQSAREYKVGGLKSVYRRLFRPSSGEAPRAAAVHHVPAAAAVIAPHRLVRAGISTALASAHAKHVPDSTGPHSTRPSPSRWCVCVCVCASLTECRSYVS